MKEFQNLSPITVSPAKTQNCWYRYICINVENSSQTNFPHNVSGDILIYNSAVILSQARRAICNLSSFYLPGDVHTPYHKHLP